MAERSAQARGAAIEKAAELVFIRVCDAPRELVFDARTNPKDLAQSFGPDGFTTTTRSIDIRPGGE